MVVQFNEKSSFDTTLGISSKWDYDPDIDYFFQKEVNLTTIDENQLDCYCIDGSILNVAREPFF